RRTACSGFRSSTRGARARRTAPSSSTCTSMDAELDPFYIPPGAVSFFNQVKKEAEPRLAPLRAQKRAEQDVQKKAAAEEAERRRQRELEEERKRLQQISPSIERRVVQHEFWVTMMPFGLGQLQN